MKFTFKSTTAIFLAACPLAVFATAPNGQNALRDSLPQSWQTTEQCRQTLPADDAWWKNFGDPVLDSLISKAETNNFSVAAALKRIDMADKMVKEARAGYFPTLNANAGWTKARESGAMTKTPMPATESSYFSLGATMNWEIDVFGRVRAGVNAKKAAYNVSKADYDAVLLSLCSDVATSYMQLRTCQEQLRVAEAHLTSQEKVVKITEARYEADLGNMLDVTQARIVLYGTQSSVPSLKSEIKTLINSISILIGEYPGEMAPMLEPYAEMPEYLHMVDAGVPADLLRRRPDIVEAEMTLAEYAANVGLARKDYLPALSLTGSIGTSARSADDLFSNRSFTYSIAPQLSWTIFDGLARNYRTAEAKLQFEAAMDNYNMTVMNAVEEVDNAFLNYVSTLESIELQRKVVEESRKSLELSVDLYKSGLTAFSNVVDGQINWLESQNSLVALQGKALASLVNIYKSLGGGMGYEVRG